jgi:hypothetical protein
MFAPSLLQTTASFQMTLFYPVHVEEPFKGTVSQDFLLLVFVMNQFPPSPRVSH